MDRWTDGLTRKRGNCRYQNLPPVPTLLPLCMYTTTKSNSVAPSGEYVENFDYFSTTPTSTLPMPCATGPLENMTLSTKPEVHNVFYCRQRRTEPRTGIKRTENVVKFGLWFLRHTSRQKDKQTYIHAHQQYFAPLRGAK